MTQPFKTFVEDGETKFKFDGGAFSISRHDNHPCSNIEASSERGIYLFHETNGMVSFYATVETFGSRAEPHITF